MLRKRQGYTLIELLTVIAITAVILTLIIIPVVQAFNLTRAAQGFSDAQDKARTLIERITREINNSAAVRDTGGGRSNLAVIVPGQNGNPVVSLLQYAKLDIIRPAQGDPGLRGPGGGFINPDTGREDPTLKAPKGQVVLPATPGNTVIRYAIGLRDPFSPYNNPYDGLLMARGSGRDNLFVLYRIEYQPFIPQLGTFVPNADLFELDVNGEIIQDDPFFLIPDRDSAGNILAGAALSAKQDRVANWLGINRPNAGGQAQFRAKATVITEVSRYDMVLPVFERKNRRVVYDNNIPRLVPLIQFRPGAIGSEPTSGMVAVRLSEEADGMRDYAPDVYRTKFANWSSLVLRTWPSGWNPNVPTGYWVGRPDATADDAFRIFYFDPTTQTNELTEGTWLFDIDAYEELEHSNGLYPFSRAVNPAILANPTLRSAFMAYHLHDDKGEVSMSFGIDEVGPVAGLPRPDPVPTPSTGAAVTPINDPDTSGNWYDARFSPSNVAYEINKSFNKIWREQQVVGGPINFNLLPNIHRFVDLRVLPMSDGTESPLHPNVNIGLGRAQIVPGSEVIVGPDQNPGPNYGNPIRYQRVTKNPGPNQYAINYADKAEPRDPVTGVIDYSLIGLPNPSATYSSTDFVSAIIQPRFKSGYVQFNSDPTVPLPQGNISIFYRFQLNRVGDTFSADYDSRQLMSVLLTIRNLAQTTNPNPQGITLEGTATVRNVLR